MDLIPSIQITGDALSAQRVRTDIIAQNIANAQTTRDVNGQPYQRKVVSFETVLTQASKDLRASGGDAGNDAQMNIKTVRVSGISNDTSEGERVYNPSHPHADKEGFVAMPNVQVAQEMVDLISSSRAYEANLTVARNSKLMAEAALRMGR